ncbi:MAG: hypothetical protein HYS73_01605, partial [Parcubacteria group bacterium]|nr:hypothetical protein [Parcubacteria group bacterium]
MSEIDTLSQYFARFPGIGSRQAKRFVYFLLSSHPQFAKEMSLRIAALVQKVAQCRECRRYFEPNNPQQSAVCVLCADGVSDKTKLIVVEKDVDLEAVQKSG